MQKKFHKCFKKVRIKKGGKTLVGNRSIQHLLKIQQKTKRLIKKTSCHCSLDLLNQFLSNLDKHIEKQEADINADKIKEYIKTCNDENGLNRRGFWKMKKKLCPKHIDPPMAKHDSKGNLITNPAALKKLYLQTYTERLSHRPMKPELLDIFYLKSELWKFS